MIGTLIAAWIDVRSKPLRTLTAIAGMVAAVIAVVLVDAAGVLSRDANVEYIATTYGRAATLSISSQGGTATQAEAEALANVLVSNGVISLSSNVSLQLVLVDGRNPSSTASASGAWVSSTYPQNPIFTMEYGDFPAPSGTAKSDTLHAVITSAKAQELGYSGANAVGAVLWTVEADRYAGPNSLKTTPMTPIVIDGVADRLGSSTNGADIVLVSDLYRNDLLKGASIGWIAQVAPEDTGLVQDLVQNSGPKDAGGTPKFTVQRTDRGDQLAPVLGQQRITAGIVMWVALTVGGLGILGVGLAGVRERGKDYGLRRALGASTGRVFTGVIVQSLLEVLLAAAIAIPVSAIAIEIFARQLVLSSLPLPSSVGLPLSSVVRGLVGALVVGLIAGLLPAFRAARASVVQALRG